MRVLAYQFRKIKILKKENITYRLQYTMSTCVVHCYLDKILQSEVDAV